jgi:tRNA A37 threonylcarbamoyladenosine dehydratase
VNENWLGRTELLFSSEKIETFKKANILLGGVGAYAAEMLARAGVGKMTIIDNDTVGITNLNRQLLATHSTMNRPKTEVMAERLRDINPDIELTVYDEFLSNDRTLEVLKSQPYDYVVDAIDTLTPKLHLILFSLQENIKIVSSMGAGGKSDPSKIETADISKSYNCRLAKSIRKRLHHEGKRRGVKVVFSSELPDREAIILTDGEQNKKSIVGTISYMPAIFGCMVAAEVLRDL